MKLTDEALQQVVTLTEELADVRRRSSDLATEVVALRRELAAAETTIGSLISARDEAAAERDRLCDALREQERQAAYYQDRADGLFAKVQRVDAIKLVRTDSGWVAPAEALKAAMNGGVSS